VCGPAFTVRTYPGATHGCDLALAQARPGEVVVLAAGGYTEVILWGEIYSAYARQLGVGGTVIDGAARDLSGIREVGYPVFARAATPRGGTFDNRQSETQLPVSCAGVVVRPGDLVRGDETGVVVVPAEIAESAIAGAEALARREARILALLRAGVPLAEALRQSAQADR
jgi:4-hydroxy-4-methyl-2-oxoglutarate aldolase